MYVSKKTPEFHVVEMKREDVREAIIDRARREVTSAPHGHYIDEKFAPTVVEDGYGCAQVFFKAADAPTLKKVG